MHQLIAAALAAVAFTYCGPRKQAGNLESDAIIDSTHAELLIGPNPVWRRMSMLGFDPITFQPKQWPKTLVFEYGLLTPAIDVVGQRLSILPGAISIMCKTGASILGSSQENPLTFDFGNACAQVSKGEIFVGHAPESGIYKYRTDLPWEYRSLTGQTDSLVRVTPENWGHEHWKRNYNAITAATVSGNRIFMVGQGINSNVLLPVPCVGMGCSNTPRLQNSIKTAARAENGSATGLSENWKSFSSFATWQEWDKYAPIGWVEDYGPVLWSPGVPMAREVTDASGQTLFEEYPGTNSPWPTSIIVRQGYAYIFFFAGEGNQIGMARAKIKTDGHVDAGNFYYYYNGSFSEKALPDGFHKDNLLAFRTKAGGKFSPLFSSPEGPSTFFDVVQIRESDVYLALHEHVIKGTETEGDGAAVDAYFSKDLKTWIKGPRIESIPKYRRQLEDGSFLRCGWGCSFFSYARSMNEFGQTGATVRPENMHLIGNTASGNLDFDKDGDTDLILGPPDLPYKYTDENPNLVQDAYLLHSKPIAFPSVASCIAKIQSGFKLAQRQASAIELADHLQYCFAGADDVNLANQPETCNSYIRNMFDLYLDRDATPQEYSVYRPFCKTFEVASHLELQPSPVCHLISNILGRGPIGCTSEAARNWKNQIIQYGFAAVRSTLETSTEALCHLNKNIGGRLFSIVPNSVPLTAETSCRPWEIATQLERVTTLGYKIWRIQLERSLGATCHLLSHVLNRGSEGCNDQAEVLARQNQITQMGYAALRFIIETSDEAICGLIKDGLGRGQAGCTPAEMEGRRKNVLATGFNFERALIETSDEAICHLLKDTLNRGIAGCTPTEIQGRRIQIVNNGYALVRWQIERSDEALGNLYLSPFGRLGTGSEITGWRNRYDQGMSFGAIKVAIANGQTP